MLYACLCTVLCLSTGIAGLVLAIIDIDRYNFGLFLALLSVVGSTVSVAFWIVQPKMCRSPAWFQAVEHLFRLKLAKVNKMRPAHDRRRRHTAICESTCLLGAIAAENQLVVRGGRGREGGGGGGGGGGGSRVKHRDNSRDTSVLLVSEHSPDHPRQSSSTDTEQETNIVAQQLLALPFHLLHAQSQSFALHSLNQPLASSSFCAFTPSLTPPSSSSSSCLEV